MTISKNRMHFKVRTRAVLSAVILVAFLLVVRLYFLQVIHGSEFRTRASKQYVSLSGGFYNRGNIFFTDKDGREISAATIKTGYLLAIKPVEIKDAATLYTALAPYITLKRETFMFRATKKGDPYEEIQTNLTNEQAKEIRTAKLTGVLLVPEHWRYYPGGALASRTIGFVAYDGKVKDGRYGLERYYEDVLSRGKSNLYVNFFAELFTNLRSVVFVPVRKQEGSIVTTIEPSVQLYLEKELGDLQKKWKSKFSAGIIMNPQTGEIIAMATSPTFNLNDFEASKTSQFVNPLVENVYEMGSIMKPLTMAAGLDSGSINVDSTYDDRGHVTLNGSTIYNYDKRARGVIPMQQILSQSLNVGAAHIVSVMGNDVFRKYMYRYGFNEKTGIDLPNEAHDLDKNLTSPRDLEYATASFGQGIAVTPMSMIRALSVLPDGYIEQPHIVSAIKTINGLTHKIDYSDERKQVLKPKTSEEITRMLVKVFDDAMLGGTVKMKHYSIAAKTGTAQIASPNGGYYTDRYLHSYFGYFPAYDAKYIIFLMTVEPKGVKYASHSLTKPFVDLTKFLINYYNVPPDR